MKDGGYLKQVTKNKKIPTDQGYYLPDMSEIQIFWIEILII